MGQALNALINEEQMLYLGLHVMHTVKDESDPVRDISDAIVVGCVIDQFFAEGRESFTEEETQEKVSTLLADFILTKMVRDGTLKADFRDDGEIVYTLDEKGKVIAQALQMRDQQNLGE